MKSKPAYRSFFRKKAAALLRQPARLFAFLKLAENQLKHPGRTLKGVTDELKTMLRLLKAWAKRDYRQVSWVSLVKIASCLLYFVAVIDFIPDFVFGVGLVDDLTFILITWQSLRAEIDKFREWEALQKIEG